MPPLVIYGMAELAECVDLSVEDIPGCLAFAKAHQIDLTVVGPEVPLVMGMVDAFEAAGLKVRTQQTLCSV